MSVQGVAGPIDIAVSGMQAQSKQMEIISSNIANARTTNDGKGQPYRRLEAIFRANGDGASSVEIDRVAQDMSALQRVFDPGNPNADATGYVSMPNVQLPVEMMNLSTASRAYQASAAILKRYQKLVETTLELLR